MDPEYYRSGIHVFNDFYNKGYIYRGKRMVNWCPASQTALSDEEVIMKPVNGFLYRVRYEGNDRPSAELARPVMPMTPPPAGPIAMARPETQTSGRLTVSSPAFTANARKIINRPTGIPVKRPILRVIGSRINKATSLVTMADSSAASNSGLSSTTTRNLRGIGSPLPHPAR
mgnify:CR=1 FL=1